MFLARALSILWLGIAVHSPYLSRIHACQETNRDGIAHDEFFSGSVQEVSETSVSVSRSLPGKNPETKVFMMDAETIVEGKLKKLARVTVGFRSHDGQDYAWRIIVRDSPE